jgi:hypothetical protein
LIVALHRSAEIAILAVEPLSFLKIQDDEKLRLTMPPSPARYPNLAWMQPFYATTHAYEVKLRRFAAGGEI